MTFYSYVFVKAPATFPSELRRRMTATKLHYVNPTTGSRDHFSVLETDTRAEASGYVAREFKDAGATSSQLAFANRIPPTPNMLKYMAQRNSEAFLQVSVQPGQADTVFNRASDPMGPIKDTHIGSATVDMAAAAPSPYQVIIGLGASLQSTVDSDIAKVRGWSEVSGVDVIRRA